MNNFRTVGMLLFISFVFMGCSETSGSVRRFSDEDNDGPEAGKPIDKQDPKPASPAPISPAKMVHVKLASGVDQRLIEAKKLLDANSFEKLLQVFDHAAAQSLKDSDKEQLAQIYYAAASSLAKSKNIAFSSMFCERGLLLSPNHQGLLRLQIFNYLDPSMNLVSGAEELAKRLVELDPADLENQYLRGKVAFEQADWDTAVAWLKKSARRGRTQNSAIVRDSWKLLELAKGKQEEINSALSMTRELEQRMKKAQIKAKSMAPSVHAANHTATSHKTGVLQGGKVVLYMTSWCKYCKKTRELLKRLKVKFEEKNVEDDQAALIEMMQLARENNVEIRGVPVVNIGGKLVVGYNEQLITSLVNNLR